MEIFKKILSKEYILLICIILLGFVLRFYRLTGIPPGLGRDEVSVAYNAYSILQTGRDEHGRILPLYFEAIGDQKLPVIIYLTVSSIALFGLNELGARFPFAFFGSLTVVFLYLLLKEIRIREKSIFSAKIILLAPFLLVINPWHLAHSRAVYEITLGTFFFTLGTYLFLKGLRSGIWFLASIVIFGTAFYTYSMTRLLSPLLLFYYIFLFLNDLKKLSKKFHTISIVLGIIILFPFLLNFFDPGGIYGPKGAIIFTSSQTLFKIMDFRSYLAGSQLAFLGPVFFNRVVMTAYEYFRNLLRAVSPEFYFANGSDIAGIGTNGQFYIIEVIAFFSGIIMAFRKAIQGDKVHRMLLGWIILTFLSASLTIGAPYATRTLFTVIPIIILTSIGWISSIQYLRRSGRYIRLVTPVLLLIYVWSITFYLISYYIRFPVVYAANWESKTKELFRYLKTEDKNVDYIVITKPEYSMYAFLLFYNRIPPQEVWTNLERHLPDPDGWKHGKKFGKYEFRDIDWMRDNTSSTSAILVSRGDEYPDKTVVTKEIFYPTRYTVYPYGQQIISLPENKTAFKIWKIISENEK